MKQKQSTNRVVKYVFDDEIEDLPQNVAIASSGSQKDQEQFSAAKNENKKKKSLQLVDDDSSGEEVEFLQEGDNLD